MKQTKEDKIKYRVTKSAATLKEAEVLITVESWNGAANRLYYAAFQIVTALMTQEGIRVKSHSELSTCLIFILLKRAGYQWSWVNSTATYLMLAKKAIMKTLFILHRKRLCHFSTKQTNSL